MKYDAVPANQEEIITQETNFPKMFLPKAQVVLERFEPWKASFFFDLGKKRMRFGFFWRTFLFFLPQLMFLVAFSVQYRIGSSSCRNCNSFDLA